MPGKMKDGLKSHKDLEHLGIRLEPHAEEKPNRKHYLPQSSYSLTTEEKREFYKCLRGAKVLTGFLSNIKRLVSMKDLKMSGYNSHDCQTMLTLFLAIAIRAIKPVHVKVVITRMCYFFNARC
uniref:Uncharacterized protein n=1 Tax=Arundo donax TaxID=35708 RepID=A0A0A9APV2_ARUDO